MPDYATIAVKAKYSKNSDRSSPKVVTTFDDYESEPDEVDYYLVDAVTGGTTVNTTKFDSIEQVVVKNTGAAGGSNVTVRASTAANAAVDHVLAPGKFIVLPDVVVANSILLTAASGTVECEVYIQGS